MSPVGGEALPCKYGAADPGSGERRDRGEERVSGQRPALRSAGDPAVGGTSCLRTHRSSAISSTDMGATASHLGKDLLSEYQVSSVREPLPGVRDGGRWRPGMSC